MSLIVSIKGFQELSPLEVYQILRLRSEVFVVEQNCVFLDADNIDIGCSHLMIAEKILLGTTRLVPPGLTFAEMSIGRVATHPSARGSGIGKMLMEKSLQYLYDQYGAAPVKIGAQLYLKKFYGSFGFVQSGDVYDEDGIDHIEMIRDVGS
jgi:ElaA protein